MEKRKNPEKDLRQKSVLFFNIGLFITMGLIVCAFEYSTKEIVFKPVDIAGNPDDIPFVLPTVQDPPPPPPKPKLKQIIEVDDEIEIDEPEDYEITDLLDDPIEIEVSSDAPDDDPIVEPPVSYAEVMPEPDGGLAAFYKYIQKNLHYPSQARRMGVEGKVFVQFVVDKTGKLTDIEVVRGIGAGCDEEVLRIMEKAPDWLPGRQNGLPVRVRRIVPINFVMN